MATQPRLTEKETRNAAICASLVEQQRRLRQAIVGTRDWDSSIARHYLAKVNGALENTPRLGFIAIEGIFGPNGYSPGIDQAIRICELAKNFDARVESALSLVRPEQLQGFSQEDIWHEMRAVGCDQQQAIRSLQAAEDRRND